MSKKLQFSGGLKKNSLSQKMLLIIWKTLKEIAKTPDELLEGMTLLDVIQKFHGTYWANKEWEAIRVLRRLESSGHVKEKDKKIYLTKKGYMEILKYQTQEKYPRWDNRWRIVIFDIPEEKRNYRDFLRNLLRWIGFRELQKSVWVFPYDARDKIKRLLKIQNLRIEDDIRFLTVEKIEQDNDLRAKFGLQ
jgi:CRISPR-associated endonuclease Cas2